MQQPTQTSWWMDSKTPVVENGLHTSVLNISSAPVFVASITDCGWCVCKTSERRMVKNNVKQAEEQWSTTMSCYLWVFPGFEKSNITNHCGQMRKCKRPVKIEVRWAWGSAWFVRCSMSDGDQDQKLIFVLQIGIQWGKLWCLMTHKYQKK